MKNIVINVIGQNTKDNLFKINRGYVGAQDAENFFSYY